MGTLAVVRSSPNSMELHGYVQQALRILSEEKGGLDAVFFMDDAACLCSKNLREGSVRAKIRDGYAALGRESGAQLLCCGRAFSDLGTAGGDVADGFQLAGNFELSALFAKAERTVEF